jgi:hypothetical protein
MEEGYIPPITPSKIYESVDKWDDDCKILNDRGFYSWELNDNFIPLEQWREQQLNKLI